MGNSPGPPKPSVGCTPILAPGFHMGSSGVPGAQVPALARRKPY